MRKITFDGSSAIIAPHFLYFHIEIHRLSLF
jgi:hypothetical protein